MILMTKEIFYSKEVVLETINNFRTMRFFVDHCTSTKECDDELKRWIKEYPELLEIKSNRDILRMSLNWEV